MSTPDQGPAPQPPSSNDHAAREARRRQTRRLIVTTLLAGGAFELTGWQAQAHGNRSSHNACSSAALAPEDYVIMRQQLLAPSAEETQQLTSLVTQMQQMKTVDPAAEKSPAYQQLSRRKLNIEDRIRLRPVTRQVLQFLSAGNLDAAVATIEGQGATERVLANYEWTLLDLAHAHDDHGAVKPQTLASYTKLAEAAMAYAQAAVTKTSGVQELQQTLAVKVRAAEVLHNIASFLTPDTAKLDHAQLKLGRRAATEALTLRQQIGQQHETMRAHWIVARHAAIAGDLAAAHAHLNTSLEQATKLKDREGLAWGKSLMAELVEPTDPAAAKALRAEAAAHAHAAKAEGAFDMDHVLKNLSKASP